MRFVNLQNNEIIDAPTEQHSDLLANRNFAPVTAMDKVYFRNADGEEFEGTNLDDARSFVEKNGGQILSPQQISVSDWKKSPVLGRLAAGVAGAARGASFGGTDVAANLVPGLKENLAGLEEAFPVVSTAGEIGGAIVSPIGNKVLAGAKVASELLPVAKPLVKAGAEAAMRGAAFGAGAAISDLALEDAPLTAEYIASTMAKDMLIGAGADIGMSGLIKGASKGFELARDSKMLEGSGTKLADFLGAGYAKTKSVISGLDKESAEALKKAFTTDRQEVLQAMNYVKDFERNSIGAISELKDTASRVHEAAIKLRQQFRDQLTPVVSDETKNSVADSLLRTFDRNISMMKNKKSFYDSATKGRLEQIRKDLAESLPNSHTMADMHEAVEKARMTLDEYTSFGMDVSKGVQKNTKERMLSIRNALKSNLEDAKLYGEFGSKYADINKAMSASINARNAFDKLLTRSSTNPDGSVSRVIDEGKILGWLSNPSAARTTNKTASIDDLITTMENLGKTKILEGMTNISTLGPELRSAIEGIKKNRELILNLNRIESNTGKSLAGGLIGYGAGSIFGAGIAGGAAGAALENPKLILRLLGKLDNIQISNKKPTPFMSKELHKSITSRDAILKRIEAREAAVSQEESGFLQKTNSGDVMPAEIDPDGDYVFVKSVGGFRKITGAQDTGIVAGKQGGGNVYSVEVVPGKEFLQLPASELGKRMDASELREVASVFSHNTALRLNEEVKALVANPSGKLSLRKIRALATEEGQKKLEKVYAITDEMLRLQGATGLALEGSAEGAVLSQVSRLKNALNQQKNVVAYKGSGNSKLDRSLMLLEDQRAGHIKSNVETDFAGKLDQYAALPKGRVAVDVLAGSIAEGMRNESQRKKLREYLANDDVEGLGKAQENYNTVSPTLSSAASVQAAGVKNWLQNNFPVQRNSLRPGAKEIAPTPVEMREFAIKAGAALDPMGTIQRASEAGQNLHPIALKTIQTLYPRIYLQMISSGSQKGLGNDVGGIAMLQEMHKKPATETPDENIKAKITPPKQTETGRITNQ